MKKIICFLLLSLSISAGFAQIQRKTNKMQSDSSTMVQKKANMKAKMQELNLSKEQKGKIKEMNQEGKASKENIENDTTLNEQQKMKKMRELRKDREAKMNSILTDEQKVKLKEMKMNKNGDQ